MSEKIRICINMDSNAQKLAQHLQAELIKSGKTCSLSHAIDLLVKNSKKDYHKIISAELGRGN